MIIDLCLLCLRPWIAPDDGRSHLSTHLFAVTASSAYNRFGEEVPLPELFGAFDLGILAKAMVELGYQNPLKTEWQGAVYSLACVRQIARAGHRY